MKEKRQRNLYMRQILRRRAAVGELALIKDMDKDPEYHRRYFR